MLKIQYNFEFIIQLWKIINPQSTIFWKSNFYWTYVIKNCQKLNAKRIAVCFHCVVRADARGNVNREQNKWHRAPVRLESGGTSFPRKITPLRSHPGKVNRGDCLGKIPTIISPIYHHLRQPTLQSFAVRILAWTLHILDSFKRFVQWFRFHEDYITISHIWEDQMYKYSLGMLLHISIACFSLILTVWLYELYGWHENSVNPAIENSNGQHLVCKKCPWAAVGLFPSGSLYNSLNVDSIWRQLTYGTTKSRTRPIFK